MKNGFPVTAAVEKEWEQGKWGLRGERRQKWKNVYFLHFFLPTRKQILMEIDCSQHILAASVNVIAVV